MARPLPAYIGHGHADRKGERFTFGGRIGEFTDRDIRAAQAAMGPGV